MELRWLHNASAPTRKAVPHQQAVTVLLLLCLLAVPVSLKRPAKRNLSSFIAKPDADLQPPNPVSAQSPCPLPYPRHSEEDIRNGQLPYLLGGSPQPCKSCRNGDIPEFCQFLRPVPDQARSFQHTAHMCSPEQRQGFLQYLLQQVSACTRQGHASTRPSTARPMLLGLSAAWLLLDSMARPHPFFLGLHRSCVGHGSQGVQACRGLAPVLHRDIFSTPPAVGRPYATQRDPMAAC